MLGYDMRRTPLPTCRTLLSDARGVTALEFSLVSPVLMLLVCGTLEYALVMLAQQVMEGATFNASRSGKTGYVAEDKTRQQTIIDELTRRAGMLLDINQVTISTKAYSQFDQIGQPEPFVDTDHDGVHDAEENYTDVNGNGVYDTDMGAASLGTSGQVVVYTISYPWKIVTPVVANFLGYNGIVTLSARTVIKNEPY